MSLELDLSAKRRQVLVRRRETAAAIQSSAMKATQAFDVAAGRYGLAEGLLIRNEFSYRVTPAPAGSDRRLPHREHRPPATKVGSSRGLNLRLELTMLALAQTLRRPGQRWAANQLPIQSSSASDAVVGWVDLVASTAIPRTGSRNYATVNDKKADQVESALQRLAAAHLVDLPTRRMGTREVLDFEHFTLLDERGGRPAGEPFPYTVPKKNEPTFVVPQGLITRGWVHVLEDSELALLLMVACGLGNIDQAGSIAIPAEMRLLHYGIGRTAFDLHFLLENLGLLSVESIGRHDDGRAVEYAAEGAALHRLRLIPEGFDQSAPEHLVAVLNRLVPPDK